MPNQKGFSKIAIIIIVLILIGGVYFVFSKKDGSISIQDTENQNSRSNQLSTSSSPSVRIISPNGGEKLEVGKYYQIKWESIGLGIGDKVYMYIGYKYDNMIANQVFAFPENTGNFNWKPDIKPGSYKIKIKIYNDKKKKEFSDSSDEFFDIVASSANKLKGDSNLDDITNCEDIRHIFDVSFVDEIYNLDNSDYNKDGEIDLEDARLLISDLEMRGIKCLSIDSISPLAGPVGTEITLNGLGFDLPFPGEFSEPDLNFGKGILTMWEWKREGNKLSFKVPSEICMHNTSAIGDCFDGLTITPGVYEIFFNSAFGQSNKVKFTVTQ